MSTEREPPAGTTARTSKKPQAITKKKMSPQQEQYRKAIAMPSAELGAAINGPTKRIAQHLGNALAHDTEAKKERHEAQREFQENIAFYYEAKQRLLNPGYRTDVDGGKDRTPSENERNFGAPDWATFAKQCVAYSLQYANRRLKAFAKENGLLTEGGENIDDPEPEEDRGARRPRPRRTDDPIARKRYEFIATAAMEIASRNPEGEVEKQILAAAEHVPAPVMPLPPDLFTEVLSFVSAVSSSAADENVRLEAKRLAAKMRLHVPAPEPSAVPPEVAKEERRKRDKRLAKKNGRPLGSLAYNPPASGTSEHVQRFEPTPPPGGSGGLGKGALPAQDAETSQQAELAGPTPRPGAEPPIPEAAATEQIEAAGVQGGELDSFCPGDWITLDPACKSLGRIERQKGNRFLVTPYNKKPNEWGPKPKLVEPDKIHRRLPLAEVREKFPGAPEAWSLQGMDDTTPAPTPCPPSKVVHKTFPGGPEVLKVTVTSELGDAPRVKYYVCVGDQSHSYPTLAEAKAACDRIAGETLVGGAGKPPALVKTPEHPVVRDRAGKGVEHKPADAAAFQGAGLAARETGVTPAKKGSEEYRLRKARQRREYYQRKKEKGKAQAAALIAMRETGPQGVAGQGPPQLAAAPAADASSGKASAAVLPETDPRSAPQAAA